MNTIQVAAMVGVMADIDNTTQASREPVIPAQFRVCSSAGRALRSHRRGRRFNSGQIHQDAGDEGSNPSQPTRKCGLPIVGRLRAP